MSAYCNPRSPSTGLGNSVGHQAPDVNVQAEEFGQQLAKTNINQQTYLATDYLNHFNEIVMLIDMLPSMPECFEDICIWQPKSYENHFSDSGFRDKDLAILAYQRAPVLVRRRFDETIDGLDRGIIDAIESLKETYEMGVPEHLAEMSGKFAEELRHHIDHASAIINGSNKNEAVRTYDFSTRISIERDSIEKTQAAVEEMFNE